MYHTSIALEQGEHGRIQTLNFAPGPMETDMVKFAAVHQYTDKIVKTEYESVRYANPAESAKLCVQYALSVTKSNGEEAEFQSGGFFDAYTNEHDWD